MRAERQKHGFLYEERKIKELGLNKFDDYTNPYDAYLGDSLYQIKTTKLGNSIDMGDFFRNKEKDKDFFLIVGFWEGTPSNIVEEHILFIQADKYRELLEFNESEEMKKWIKGVSNEKAYDSQWKKEINFWKEKYGKRKVSLRFKRDHKSQKRIQCGINKTDFYSFFVKEFGIE